MLFQFRVNTPLNMHARPYPSRCGNVLNTLRFSRIFQDNPILVFLIQASLWRNRTFFSILLLHIKSGTIHARLHPQSERISAFLFVSRRLSWLWISRVPIAPERLLDLLLCRHQEALITCASFWSSITRLPCYEERETTAHDGFHPSIRSLVSQSA